MDAKKGNRNKAKEEKALRLAEREKNIGVQANGNWHFTHWVGLVIMHL